MQVYIHVHTAVCRFMHIHPQREMVCASSVIGTLDIFLAILFDATAPVVNGLLHLLQLYFFLLISQANIICLSSLIPHCLYTAWTICVQELTKDRQILCRKQPMTSNHIGTSVALQQRLKSQNCMIKIAQVSSSKCRMGGTNAVVRTSRRRVPVQHPIRVEKSATAKMTRQVFIQALS